MYFVMLTIAIGVDKIAGYWMGRKVDELPKKGLLLEASSRNKVVEPASAR